MKALPRSVFRVSVFCLLSLIIPSIPVCMAGDDSGVPRVVEESLVTFAPNLALRPGEACQGIRIAERLVATSPHCVSVARQASALGELDVLNRQGETVGKVSLEKDKLQAGVSDQDVLLELFDTVSNEFDTYPLLKASNVPLMATFVYFKNDEGAVTREPVNTTQLVSSGEQDLFDATSSSHLPPGAVVMNDRNKLVCLISLKNRCVGVPLVNDIQIRQLRHVGYEFHCSGGDGSGYGRDCRYYDGGGEFAVSLLYVVPVLAISAAVSAGLFYGILWVKSRQVGMSWLEFWPNMCFCSYCVGWAGLSTVLCTLGSVLCVPTAGVFSAPLFWAAPFIAAWNWIEQYTITEALRPVAANQNPVYPSAVMSSAPPPPAYPQYALKSETAL